MDKTARFWNNGDGIMAELSVCRRQGTASSISFIDWGNFLSRIGNRGTQGSRPPSKEGDCDEAQPSWRSIYRSRKVAAASTLARRTYGFYAGRIVGCDRDHWDSRGA